MFDLLIIFLLLFFHGIIALAEIAFVSSKRVRLQEQALSGNKSAATALRLLDEPEDLLSTIQFGITVLEIIAGVYGGASFADKVTPVFQAIPLVNHYAAELSYIFVVSFITYLSVIIGDLVPKAVGLANPERYAILFAPFMLIAKKSCMPVVRLFSGSTKFIVNLFAIGGKNEPPVTAQELKLLIHEAYQYGVLQSRESELLQSILQFNSVKINEIMKPADQIIWIDYKLPHEKIHELILSNDYYRFPVYADTPDNVIGVVTAKEFLTMYHANPDFRLEEILYDPLIIPPDIDALRLLEKFRNVRSYLALVTDTDGKIVGMITLQNLVEVIVGKLPDFYETHEDRFYRREDGTILMDAGLLLEEVQECLGIEIDAFLELSLGAYFHIALGRIPKVGDKLLLGGYTFEIVDMDGVRVDKLLAKKL